MLLASTYITVDPIRPWNAPGYGLLALTATAIVLVGLTIWTYLGVGKITRGRLLVILLLRLTALAVAVLLVLRPSLAHQDDETLLPSKLLVLVDSSESMNLTDEVNGLSRWDNARRILAAGDVTNALSDLALKHKIELVYYQGAEGIARLEPETKATGKRTDFGTWLHDLWQIHHGDTDLRGLVIFSDGADNGTRYAALKEAGSWAGSCPISVVKLGSPKTSLSKRDVALVDIQPPLQPVPIKTQFSVAGRINAFGFEGASADVSLWIEDRSTGKMTMLGRKERIVLPKSQNNEVVLLRDAPTKAGEYKITLKVDPLPGEVSTLNNEISSFITATGEGVSILWVEGRKRLESSFALRYALNKDRRFRVYPAEKLRDGSTGEADWFNFAKQKYDVIVIGDITAKRFSGDNVDVFRAIKKAVVDDGTGLLLLGGHDSFLGNDKSGWNEKLATDLAELLPVTLNVPGQVDAPVQVVPTQAGLSYYLMKLADDPAKNAEIWTTIFKPLDGMTHLGTVKSGAVIMAAAKGKSANDEPILVGTQVNNGRVLVFGGDTTWRAWRRTPEAVAAYERFWKNTMLWLARQEDLEGAAWVKLDARRLSAGVDQRLGFSVGLHGKGNVELKNAQFTAKVIGPETKPETVDVPIVTEDDGQRGYFLRTGTPGEYRVEVNGKGKDVDGKDIDSTASARFVIAAEDLENLHPAANHDFLDKLARAGGGRSLVADESEFVKYLTELTAQKQTRTSVEVWPDWRRKPPTVGPEQSPSTIDQLTALWTSAALPCLIVFVSCIALEWYLRRRWNLV